MNLDDHELLAQTTRGTPMGDLLRRYWTAALLSKELPERDGAPVRVRLMGEDLIAFRDTHGRVGLLREFCSHRGASLYFGHNGEGGLRCWYHGWKYDVDGNCIDQPNEAPRDRFNSKIKQPCYPCIEKNGVIWAYLGPKDKMPPLPDLEWLLVPESHVYVSKRIQDCHWTQGMDGDLDSSHLAFLHRDVFDARLRNSSHESAKWTLRDSTPDFEVVPTPAGMMYATRREADADTYYWKVGHWFFPGYTMIPGFVGAGPLGGHAWVPIDDDRLMVFAFSWHPTRPLTAEERQGKSSVADFHSELIPGTFTPVHNKSNDYAGPDAPPAQQPWMRIKKVQHQDVAMTESMGPLYDRTQEHLGKSDTVLVQARQRLINAARRLGEGAEPPGLDPKDFRRRPISWTLPRNVPSWADAIAEAIDARPETFRASV
jgi:phthalate 4,5-dioxygenase